jgi:hypothetical protein
VEQVTTIGLNIAEYVFQVHGADAAGHVLFRKRVTCAKLLGFLAAQTPCVKKPVYHPAAPNGVRWLKSRGQCRPAGTAQSPQFG